MFMQVDRSTRRSQGGLGIGLTLVRSLADLHGGTVTAESAGLGKGSIFTLRLPAVEPPLPAAKTMIISWLPATGTVDPAGCASRTRAW